MDKIITKMINILEAEIGKLDSVEIAVLANVIMRVVDQHKPIGYTTLKEVRNTIKT